MDFEFDDIFPNEEKIKEKELLQGGENKNEKKEESAATEEKEPVEIKFDDNVTEKEGPEKVEKEKQVPELAKLLKEQGYIEELPEDYSEPADILEYAVNTKIEDMLRDLPEEVAEFNKYVLQGGDPTEYLLALREAKKVEVDLDNIDDTNTQEAIINNYLSMLGESPEDIKEQIEYYKDSGKLKKMAEKYAPKIKEQKKKQLEQAAIRAKEAKDAEKRELQLYKKELEKVLQEQKEIDGFIFDEKDKKSLPSFVYDKRIKAGKGIYISQMHKKLAEVLQEPKKVLILAKILKSDFDFSDLLKKAETQEAGKLEDKLQRKRSSAKTSLADLLLGGD